MRSRYAKFAILIALVALGACSSSPKAPDKSASTKSSTPSAPQEKGNAAPSKGDAKSPPAEAGAPAAAQPAVEAAPLPPEAVQRFDRAVGMMASNATQAEREFASLSDAYPQYSGAQVNLGILQAKAGRLDDAQKSLANAVQRNPGNAVA